MKIGVIGDAHLGTTDFSVKRRADFSAAFKNGIDLCLRHGAEVICLLGDVFDSAATRRDVDAFAEIIKEISPALNRLSDEDIPLVAIPGILALSLRYGLLRVAARGVNFLILDEPTRHMDTGNCRRLKALFNDLLDRQLIVVTVNSEFSDATGRHFRIAKDDTLHSVVAEAW